MLFFIKNHIFVPNLHTHRINARKTCKKQKNISHPSPYPKFPSTRSCCEWNNKKKKTRVKLEKLVIFLFLVLVFALTAPFIPPPSFATEKSYFLLSLPSIFSYPGTLRIHRLLWLPKVENVRGEDCGQRKKNSMVFVVRAHPFAN